MEFLLKTELFIIFKSSALRVPMICCAILDTFFSQLLQHYITSQQKEWGWEVVGVGCVQKIDSKIDGNGI